MSWPGGGQSSICILSLVRHRHGWAHWAQLQSDQGNRATHAGWRLTKKRSLWWGTPGRLWQQRRCTSLENKAGKRPVHIYRDEYWDPVWQTIEFKCELPVFMEMNVFHQLTLPQSLQGLLFSSWVSSVSPKTMPTASYLTISFGKTVFHSKSTY